MMRLATETNQQEKPTIKNQNKAQFTIHKIIGTGTFGKVYLATWKEKERTVALKNVLQNKRYKNRELQILKEMRHPGIVQLYHFFYEENPDGTYLNLAMEYVPETLSRIIKQKYVSKEFIPNQVVKKYAYWILNALVYMAQYNISHRDIKPSNILIGENHQAKICDFGSAKALVNGQNNLAYICSRFYRAPQLILGAVEYTTQIDIWSAGCVLGQTLINSALFEGSSNTNQMSKIMKVLGCPTEQDYEGMRVKKIQMQVVDINGIGIENKIKKINSNADPELLNLIKRMLVYNPKNRITPKEALSLPLFNKFQPLVKSLK